jgi:predicted metal-binding membrane protein
MPALRAAAGSLWWRPAACPRERAVIAALVTAIAGTGVALVATAVAGASGGAGGTGMAGMPGMSGMAGMAGMSEMAGMAGMSSAGASTTTPSTHHALLFGGLTVAGVAMWALMIVAMMLPSALPAVRHVAANSLRARRPRAMATFAAVYVLVWVAFGVLILAVSPAWSALDGAVVAAGALAVAAAWQLSAPKRRALRDCHRPTPLPPAGRRATAGVMRFALRNGTACVRSCWAMMLAMSVAATATTFWMLAITGLVLVEKLAPRPRQATRAGALVLAAGSLAVAASALIS